MRLERAVALALVAGLGLACATSRSTTPRKVADLPRFQLARLKGQEVRVVVLDHRAEAVNSQEWVSRVVADLSAALTNAQAKVLAGDGGSGDKPFPLGVVLEARILHLRSDFELGQWKGCAKLAVELRMGDQAEPIAVEADRCVTKSNLWGYATASKVLSQAYQDAVAELLSSLDRQLR
jgi:hypothetical protein